MLLLVGRHHCHIAPSFFMVWLGLSTKHDHTEYWKPVLTIYGRTKHEQRTPDVKAMSTLCISVGTALGDAV